jgi:hypothetical protein
MFAKELLKTMPRKSKKEQKSGGFSHKQLGLDNSKILPIHERKITVLVRLTSILPKSNEPPSSLLMAEVNFLIAALKKTNTFSLQVIQDFEQLLSSIDALVKSVPLTAKQMARAAQFPREFLVKGKLELPLQLLKDYWRKCLKCGNLQFGSKDNIILCDNCDTSFSGLLMQQDLLFKK